MEANYELYDKVVNTILTNILIEKERMGKFIIHGFNPSMYSHRLYFNIMTVAADLQDSKIYLDLSPWKYIKFKRSFKKTRTNLKWFNFFQKRKLTEDYKISVDKIMDFVCGSLQIEYSLFGEINKTYYENRGAN